MAAPLQIDFINHLNHTTKYENLTAARRLYLHTFGAAQFSDTLLPADGTNMILFYVANHMMELFQAADPDNLLVRWVERYGEGLHSIEFSVPDLVEANEQLTDAGIRCPKPDDLGFFFTHPADCHGTLIEWTVWNRNSGSGDLRGRNWNPRWNDGHGASLKQLAYFTMAVEDLDAATRQWTDLFGATLLEERINSRVKKVSRFLDLRGTVVELAQPTHDSSPLATFIQESHPGFYSITWEATSIDAAADWMTRHKLRLQDRASSAFTIDPADFFGARHSFTGIHMATAAERK